LLAYFPQSGLVFDQVLASLTPSSFQKLSTRLSSCFHYHTHDHPNGKVNHNKRNLTLRMLPVDLLNTTMDTNLATPLPFTLLDRNGFLASMSAHKSAAEILRNFLGFPSSTRPVASAWPPSYVSTQSGG
jgi:hypothetical protein